MKEVLQKFVDAINVCQKHQAEYEWKGWMRKIDMTMCNPDKHRVICIDFGATLDLCAAELDNCSVNNHAVVCILFVLSNWRKVKYKKNDDKYDETLINDCNKWMFFGDTMSRGKKNDHIFHNSCLTYLVKFYSNKRVNAGKNKIPINIVQLLPQISGPK